MTRLGAAVEAPIQIQPPLQLFTLPKAKGGCGGSARGLLCSRCGRRRRYTEENGCSAPYPGKHAPERCLRRNNNKTCARAACCGEAA